MPVTAGALTWFTVALILVFDSAQLTSQEPADWAKHRFERDLHASSFRERWKSVILDEEISDSCRPQIQFLQ